MKVSVICTVWNEAPAIERLLASLEAQSRPPDEVVIADGGSTDGTLAILAEWAGAGRLPLKVLERPGSNISEGRNAAIAAAALVFLGNALAVQSKLTCMRHNAARSEALLRQIVPVLKQDVPRGGCLRLVNAPGNNYSVFRLRGFEVLGRGLHEINRRAGRPDADVAIIPPGAPPEDGCVMLGVRDGRVYRSQLSFAFPEVRMYKLALLREILAYRPHASEPDSPNWTVRVIPNKFPALHVEGDMGRRWRRTHHDQQQHQQPGRGGAWPDQHRRPDHGGDGDDEHRVRCALRSADAGAKGRRRPAWRNDESARHAARSAGQLIH